MKILNFNKYWKENDVITLNFLCFEYLVLKENYAQKAIINSLSSQKRIVAM